MHVHTNSAGPKLFLACASGEHFKKAVLTVEKAGGAHPAPYLTITLEEVLIASSAVDGDRTDNSPKETVSLNFSKIQWQYTPQKADGSSSQPVTAGWDIRQLKAF